MMESRGHKEGKQAMTTHMSAFLLRSLQSSLQRKGLHVSLAILLSVISVSVFAGAPMPDIPKGKGEKCVEDTQFMRESHMELLLHQRDETVQRGIRTKKHSLKECIACHVVNDSNNQPVSAASSKHFCRQCHDYTAVNIDCFQCHASKPAKKSASNDLGSIKSHTGFGHSGFGIAKADPTKVGDRL